MRSFPICFGWSEKKESVPSQHPTDSTSSPSSVAGLKCTLQTGEPPARRMSTFSTPSFCRTDTQPSNCPIARSCPSEVHDTDVARAAILCLETLFWSGDQIPKSDPVALASSSVTGLYSTHCAWQQCRSAAGSFGPPRTAHGLIMDEGAP